MPAICFAASASPGFGFGTGGATPAPRCGWFIGAVGISFGGPLGCGGAAVSDGGGPSVGAPGCGGPGGGDPPPFDPSGGF